MRTFVAALSLVLLLAGCSGGTRDDEEPQGGPGPVDLTGQTPFEPDGLFSVAPQHAVLDDDELEISVIVGAVDVPLTVSPKRAVYAEGADLLKAESGPATTIEPGQGNEVVLTFAGAEGVDLDGQVTFEVSVGGQPATSVGFSLVPTPQ